jgi:hypothetical protein
MHAEARLFQEKSLIRFGLRFFGVGITLLYMEIFIISRKKGWNPVGTLPCNHAPLAIQAQQALERFTKPWSPDISPGMKRPGNER